MNVKSVFLVLYHQKEIVEIEVFSTREKAQAFLDTHIKNIGSENQGNFQIVWKEIHWDKLIIILTFKCFSELIEIIKIYG